MTPLGWVAERSMTMRTVSLVALLLALSSACSEERPAAAEFVQDSGGALLPEQAAFDVQHYDLTLAVDPELRRIEGSLTMTARAVEDLDVAVLHLDPHLAVQGVRFEDAVLDFAHENGLVRADLPGVVAAGDELRVTVDYGGTPREAPRPPWEGGFTWSTTADGRPWIATSCQGEGADLWWPCKDHPSDKAESMDLRITVPEDLVCASNGVLLDQSTADGKTTWHWQVRSPIANYTVALNIAPYEKLEADYTSVAGTPLPVQFYVRPESAEQARAILPEFVDHLRFFEETLGPYPFRAEKYGIAETPHLGMEHQTIIAYGNEFQGSKFGYDWLHHHELSHEWWANLVTCRDWKDMWIHEGFGTYMQALYLEEKLGAEAYREEMADKRAQIRNVKPVAPREVQSSKEIYFAPDGTHDNDIYFKGSWILHTLRWLLGDEDFFRFLRRMAYPSPALAQATDGSQVRFADTEEVLRMAEEVSGRELDWFFEIYLRQPELPRLELEQLPDALHLRWSTPGDLPFPMPIPVRVGSQTLRLAVPEEGTSMPLDGTEVVLIDPEQRVLKR